MLGDIDASKNNLESDSALDVSGINTNGKSVIFYSNSKNDEIVHDPFSKQGKKNIENLQLNAKPLPTKSGDKVTDNYDDELRTIGAKPGNYDTLQTQMSESNNTPINAKSRKGGLGTQRK